MTIKKDMYIEIPELHDRVVGAEDVASWIEDGMTLGLSGFTRAGDAKAVPFALIERAKKEPLSVNIFTGASLGSDIDKMFAEVGLVNKRIPFQADRTMRQKINDGEMMFVDHHLGVMAEDIRSGVLGEIDYAVIEAIKITEDGKIIPTTSVGNSSNFVANAKKVVVEINQAHPEELEGVHDIYEPAEQGKRDPIPLTGAADRIGESGISVDPEKIVGIVFTNNEDSPSTILPPDEETDMIAEHLIKFLKKEVEAGRLTNELAPLQAGIGTVANAVLYGLLETDFENLEVYSEVLQDAVFDLIDEGKVTHASACSMTLSEEKMKKVFNNFDDYKDKLVLRPQEISNHVEIIRRLGIISINTALEVDIYGNVNSTHVNGSYMMNGIGGSGDFARNAGITVFVTSSVAKDGAISSIVPFASHVDHTEHDVDVIVTDQGYADLRGLSPLERAEEIINNCAHPLYRDQLKEYVEEAKLKVGGQTPHILEKALSWHIRAKETGTMLEKELVKQ